MSRQTITRLSLLVVMLYGLMIANSFGTPQGWLLDDKGRVGIADYIALHAAGRLALEGRPEAAYDRNLHRAAQDAIAGRNSNAAFPYAYPPTFFPVTASFAAMPYVAALVLFPLSTLLLFSLVAAGITGRAEGAIWMLATPAVLWNFCAAQNGFLNAAVLGAALLALPARPLLAGVLIGLLSYKPHLGLLLPLALAAAGYWRTFAVAAATAVLTVLVSIVLFGAGTWLAFIDSISQFGAYVLSDAYSRPWRLQSLYGALRTLGLGASMAVDLQYVWGVVLAAAVVVVWRRRDVSYDLKAAGLAVATVLVSPYLFIYDLPVLTIAQAFLVRHMLRHGADLKEIIVLLAANLAIFAYLQVPFPVSFLASLAIGGLVAARALGQTGGAAITHRPGLNPA